MGTIFAIKKYAIHDGPNIRTTIFLKGCPLSCRWCHNPEGMEGRVDLLWNGSRCVGCGECIAQCPTGSLSLKNHSIVRDEQQCSRCLSCVEVCPALAHESTGWQTDAAAVMAEIKKDIPFFDESGGGVTFSGGEPLMQPEFLLELLRSCGDLGIHRAVDTCAFAAPAQLLEVADNCELFLIDLKHMDSEKHKRHTAVPNERILKNIRILAERGSPMIIRIPLIEGFNSDEENIRRSGEFLTSLPTLPLRVDLLPYHSIAGGKYKKLGLADPDIELPSLPAERVGQCEKILSEMKLKVQVGG